MLPIRTTYFFNPSLIRINQFISFYCIFAGSGIKLRALRVLDKCSTTEQHHQSSTCFKVRLNLMDLQGQIDSTVTMALQNKKTLDMLAAT
jgi:hypothetical protein